MTTSGVAAVVLAGGLGTRMRSETPKHLHVLLGRRLVDWVVAAAEVLDPQPLVVVTGADYADAFDGLTVAVQQRPLGTGDALAAARPSLKNHDGAVLVLAGDAPLLRGDTLRRLLETHRGARAAATVLTSHREDPADYGRIVRAEDGSIRAIVEAADASEEERAIREVNSSIYVFDSAQLWPAVEGLDPANA